MESPTSPSRSILRNRRHSHPKKKVSFKRLGTIQVEVKKTLEKTKPLRKSFSMSQLRGKPPLSPLKIAERRKSDIKEK